MWISLSRDQPSRRSSRLMPSAAHSSIPPPGPPARPERRKNDERKHKGKDKQDQSRSTRVESNNTQPSAPQLPDEINENYGPSSLGVRTAWGSPPHRSPETITNEAEGGLYAHGGPTRKSFRLSGRNPDLNAERNMLPMWLEEGSCEEMRQSGCHFLNRNEAVVVHDNSFESRWNSMKGRNKKRPSIPFVRPPGWEDVGQQGRLKRKNSNKVKSNFCPSFTINDIARPNSQQGTSTVIQPLSPPITVNIEPPPPCNWEPPINRYSSQTDAFNMDKLSANVNNIFSDSFLQEGKCSISISNLGPQSTSNSGTGTPSQASASLIADRHLWASTDSFICEDFSFCSGRPPRDVHEEYVPPDPPRSYSQILMNNPESDRREFTDYDGMYLNTDEHVTYHYSSVSTPEQDNLETEGISLKTSPMQSLEENEIDITAPDQMSEEDGIDDNFDLSGILEEEASCYEDANYAESFNQTIRVIDNLPRPNWIQFDTGSTEHFDEISIDAYDNRINDPYHQDEISCDFEHQSNFKPYQQHSIESCQLPNSPISPRNFSRSTLNLVEPRLEQTPETYKGQLVRSYSIRGRRVSKRVARTVNKKINPAEYGKLMEPIPPMYSRAVLTMHSGPGLFEQDNASTKTMASSGMNVQIEKKEIENQTLNVSTAVAKGTEPNKEEISSISPYLPKRVGSLRVPSLPTIFLRRSVSLNAPKVSRGEVPFQRLPEKRGSLQKAMSGLGAIAQSFRRRSGSIQSSTGTSSHITERASAGGHPRLHRSGSIGSSIRQIPKAPRLPRRTISHKQATTNDV